VQKDNILRSIDYAWLSDPGQSKFQDIPTLSEFDTVGADWSSFELFNNEGLSRYSMANGEFDFASPRSIDSSVFNGLFNGL
jgi:hypothetical protein